MAHWVASQCLLFTQAATFYLGRRRDFGAHRAEVTPEMAGHVQGYVNYVRQIPGRRFVEVNFTKAMQRYDPDLGGTADAVVWDAEAEELHVIDFKYGAGVEVEVDENKQLLYYALGARLALPDVSPTTITVHIYQPRHWAKDSPEETWSFPAWDVIEFAGDLKEAAERTRDPDAPVVPGPHCQFCDAAAVTCPAGEEAQELVMADDKLEIEETTVEQIAAALEVVPLVEKRCKAIRERAYSLATGGVPIPGFKIVQKRGTRKWIDEEAAAAAFEDVEGAFTEPKLRTPPQVERAVGKKSFEAMAAHLVATVSSGTTLVPESDPRPASSEAIEALFEVIPKQEK